LAIDILKMLI